MTYSTGGLLLSLVVVASGLLLRPAVVKMLHQKWANLLSACKRPSLLVVSYALCVDPCFNPAQLYCVFEAKPPIM